MEIENGTLSVSPEVFIERKEYMNAFRGWINKWADDKEKSVLFGDTESIYGTGKTTILRRLFAEYEAKTDWIAIWLSLDEYSLISHKIEEQEWQTVEAYLRNLYDYRILLETLARKLARQDKLTPPEKELFNQFEQQLRQELEKISDEKFIGFFEKLKIDVSGTQAAGAQMTIGGKGAQLTNESVSNDSWLGISIKDTQITVGGTTFNLNNLNLDTERRIKQVVLATQHDFTEAFKRLFDDLHIKLHQLQKSYHILIFGDDYCQVHQQPIGEWFLALVPGLKETASVLSRTTTGSLPDRVASHARELRLGNFSLAETQEYLEKKLIQDSLPAALVNQIYEFSAGHPLAVGLAAHVLADQDLTSEPKVNELLRFFKQMPPLPPKETDHDNAEKVRQEAAELAKRLDVLLKHVRNASQQDELLLNIIDVCSTLREFNFQIVRAILVKLNLLPEENIDNFRQVFARMEKFSFVEIISAQNTASESGVTNTETERFRIHTFVRDLLARELEKDTATFEQFHLAAQQYYSEKLKSYKDKLENPDSLLSEYEQRYHFEDPEWQNYVTEWLYHTSMLRDEAAFREAEIQLGILYYEEFQWWGWFQYSELCDRLLQQWEWTMQRKQTQRNEGTSLATYLRRFHDLYPVNAPGIAKPAGPFWKEIRSALVSMIKILKLDRIPEEDAQLYKDQRHLRALLLEYIAHSYLYSDDPKGLDTAEKLYQEINALRQANDDSWNVYWMTSYLGEIYYRMGKIETAMQTLAQSTVDAEKEAGEKGISAQDNEIIGRNFCLTGDCYWEKENYQQAFLAYTKAVFFAYAFLWYPDPPDEYNVKWYSAMRQHAAEQLIALYHARNQPDLALKYGQCMYDFWSRYWDDHDAGALDVNILSNDLAESRLESLMLLLFPASPAQEELGDETSKARSDAIEMIEGIPGLDLGDGMYQDVDSLTWGCAD